MKVIALYCEPSPKNLKYLLFFILLVFKNSFFYGKCKSWRWLQFSHKSISYPNALPGLDVKRPNGRIGTAGVQDLADSVRGHGGDGATVTFKNL